MSLSIYKKGLLLVFIPFVINLLWISLFWNSVQRSSVWLQNAGRESDVILLLSRSIVQINRVALLVFDYVKSGGDQTVESNAETEGRALFRVIDQLREANKTDNQTLAIIKRFAARVALMTDELKAIAEKRTFRQLDFPENNLTERFDAAALDASYLLNILKERDENFNRSLELEELSRNRTISASLLGLTLNLLIAIALAFYMHRSIIRRISDLTEKAHNFTNEHFDYRPVVASDEISQLDAELLVARKQWLESYRFRKVFMTMMARRLRKPLQKCVEVAAVISQEPVDHEKTSAKQARALVASVSSCLNLIDDMLLLAGSDGGILKINPEVFDIRAVACAAVELISNLSANKKVSIHNQCETVMLPIDVTLIQHVLVNLLANAIKFSPPDTVITIKSNKHAGNLRICVIDKGPGMSEEVRSRLFRKFYQSAEGKNIGGSGLGLAIAQMIVQAHRGTIGVDSEPGHGSTFWVELPATL